MNNNKLKKVPVSNKKSEEKVEGDKKNKLSRQTVGTLTIAILAVIALITGFLMSKEDRKKETSKETLDSFYKYLSSDDEAVIYYGSEGCSYCELQNPIMKQIKDDYKMDYLYIDASKLTSKEKDEIIDVLDIEGSTPTIAIVKDEKVIDTSVGYTAGTEMVEFLKENEVLEDDATYKPEENLAFIDFTKYKEIIDSKENSVIVIGQTTCSHCIAVKPVLSHVAGTYDIEINYLNLTEMTGEEQQELIKNLKDLGYENAENLGTPLTIVVKDSKIVGTIEGGNPTSYFVRQFKKLGIINE